MANGRTTHMRESAWTLPAVTKQRRVKIGAFPFDGDKCKDRQPPEQVLLVHADCVSRVLWAVVLHLMMVLVNLNIL